MEDEDIKEMMEADCLFNVNEPDIIYTPSDKDSGIDFFSEVDNLYWVTYITGNPENYMED